MGHALPGGGPGQVSQTTTRPSSRERATGYRQRTKAANPTHPPSQHKRRRTTNDGRPIRLHLATLI
ncbi:hypothetical protein CGMCC3_g12563 [Colletotrichum fructicola]|nr:uncharacterized protein CGMCC3_g12563 [Colletotrichum fructicola]KAE9571301.1 hypothetical protein CGMCC3_g12563 [Colletotrichum fructicola]